MTNLETIQRIKLALRSGDQLEIAKKIGFSKAWINQILNCKQGAANPQAQKAVIEAALEVIEERRNRENNNAKENSAKVKAILG